MANEGVVKGKVAIITGGGGGIGRATALQMAKEGAKVVVVDIGAAMDGSGGSAGPAEKVVAEIKAQGGEAIASTLSITKPENAQAIIDAAIAAFGRVDILVNNAGILRDRMVFKMSVSDWDDVIDVHLNGSFYMARACVPHFKEQMGGSIINLTSTSGLIGNIGQVNYMAAKMGLVGMARGIAMDMEKYNVRANCIAPVAWTRMTGSVKPDTPERARAYEIMEKKLGPETIAPLIVWLGSEDAKTVSSQIFFVRGNEIFLMSQPRPVQMIHRDTGWNPSNLTILKDAFKKNFTPIERTNQVIPWDAP